MTTVKLYRPDGGMSVTEDDVIVLHYDDKHIEFERTLKNGTVITYTSNLPYLIIDEEKEEYGAD